jgi:O-antigen biosynthesis protein WbqP
MSKIISFILIILICPIFILVSVLSIIMHGSPVFFRQKRLGKRGVIFTMLKFRTMKNNSPEDVATHLLDDPKKYNTRLGNLLRYYSIDEFPQLFNVFRGDMKFIGPRPSLINEKELNQMRVKLGTINSLPGITGWAQVNGRDKNTTTQKAEMELFYENNKSFYFDIKILALTIKSMLMPKDIYPD